MRKLTTTQLERLRGIAAAMLKSAPGTRADLGIAPEDLVVACDQRSLIVRGGDPDGFAGGAGAGPRGIDRALGWDDMAEESDEEKVALFETSHERCALAWIAWRRHRETRTAHRKVTIVEIREVVRASQRGMTTAMTTNQPETSCGNVRSLLLRHGARHLDEALRDNPDGPVQQITTRDACDVTYEVVVGDAQLGDQGRARVIWSRTVVFGATDRTVAGGADFVAAARAQGEVADAAHALVAGQEPS